MYVSTEELVETMGVRYLNNLIGDKCKSALTVKHLDTYANKTIVIDTSIYIYQFLGQNALMENMYLMMAQFKLHNITPIFVFDGAAPQEKRHTIQNRESSRKWAELNYIEASAKLTNLRRRHDSQDSHDSHDSQNNDAGVTVDFGNTADDTGNAVSEIIDTESAIYELRKQCVRVRGCEVLDVKRLMRAFDMRYIDADGESDNMCAQIVKLGIAHACMSNDMDMLLYGCPRVLRHFNISQETVIEYDLYRILEILDVTICEFREICILSGTDYNPNNFEPSIRHRIYLSGIFESYYRFRKSAEYGTSTFYEWIKNISWLFRRIDVQALQRVHEIFSIELTKEQLENISGVLQKNAPAPAPAQITTLSVNVVHPIRSSAAASISTFEIPARVKRIMAQYNFIYI